MQKAIPVPITYMYDVSLDGNSLAVLTPRGAEVYETDGRRRCPCAQPVELRPERIGASRLRR
jgi:hypothetical protein